MKPIKRLSALVLALFFSVCCLAGCSINTTFNDKLDDGQKQTENVAVELNNFASLATATYENINNKTVKVDTFARYGGEKDNNPNFGVAVLIAQCIDYKEKYPERDVKIVFTSFHLSAYVAACVDRDNKNFGKMRNLYDAEEVDGFVRVSYLLVKAARLGVSVLLIGQLDATGVDGRNDMDFVQYFDMHKDDRTINDESITNYLRYYRVGWTSYGDKAATDMMHLKVCAVSNYIDCDGVEYDGGFWVGSTNLDGVSQEGVNGNDGMQTGVLVSNHTKITSILFNFIELMENYVDQEGIMEFRNIVRTRNKTQIDLINQGKAEQIPDNEQLVYLGGENDDVFEFYLTPLATSDWNTTYNPFSKYINKLKNAESERIAFVWNNAKFKDNFTFSGILVNMLKEAFVNNPNLGNRLYIHCHYFAQQDLFNELQEGVNIGTKSLNQDMEWWTHAKDLQVSYMENDKRQYVTIFNTLNFHEGAFNSQINSMLVLKENGKTKDVTFKNMLDILTKGKIRRF